MYVMLTLDNIQGSIFVFVPQINPEIWSTCENLISFILDCTEEVRHKQLEIMVAKCLI